MGNTYLWLKVMTDVTKKQEHGETFEFNYINLY